MSDSSDNNARESHLQTIREVYQARDSSNLRDVYNPLRAVNVRIAAERQRILTDLLRDWLGPDQLFDKDVLEIGCGGGGNLLNFLSLGVNPARLTGNDLVVHRIDEARLRLPPSVRLHCGDASDLAIDPASFDLILQSVCFSSILDDNVLSAVAERAWSLLRPGGALLSYDFTVNNPRNRNVRGNLSFTAAKSVSRRKRYRSQRYTCAADRARGLEQLLSASQRAPFPANACVVFNTQAG